MVALIAETEPCAREALAELKRLDQTGWIDLIYYARLDRGAYDGVRVLEVSDPIEAASQSAGDGLAGNLGASLFGPAAPATGGAAPCRAYAVVVVMEAQYTERVVEELESRGFILRRQLRGIDRQAALRASIERSKMNVKWLDDFPRGDLVKAERAHDHGDEGIEAALAAVRAELGSEREKLHARLRALALELEADRREAQEQLESAAANLRDALNRHIGRIETAILDCGQDLALSILDHMDYLASRAMQVQAKAAATSSEAAKALEGQLHELEVRMRKHRAELTATLGTCALRARRCLNHLRNGASQDRNEIRQAFAEQMRRLDDGHQVLKAELRRLEKEDTRIWHERAAGFRKSCQALFDLVHQTLRQYR